MSGRVLPNVFDDSVGHMFAYAERCMTEDGDLDRLINLRENALDDISLAQCEGELSDVDSNALKHQVQLAYSRAQAALSGAPQASGIPDGHPSANGGVATQLSASTRASSIASINQAIDALDQYADDCENGTANGDQLQTLCDAAEMAILVAKSEGSLSSVMEEAFKLRMQEVVARAETAIDDDRMSDDEDDQPRVAPRSRSHSTASAASDVSMSDDDMPDVDDDEVRMTVNPADQTQPVASLERVEQGSSFRFEVVGTPQQMPNGKIKFTLDVGFGARDAKKSEKFEVYADDLNGALVWMEAVTQKYEFNSPNMTESQFKNKINEMKAGKVTISVALSPVADKDGTQVLWFYQTNEHGMCVRVVKDQSSNDRDYAVLTSAVARSLRQSADNSLTEYRQARERSEQERKDAANAAAAREPGAVAKGTVDPAASDDVAKLTADLAEANKALGVAPDNESNHEDLMNSQPYEAPKYDQELLRKRGAILNQLRAARKKQRLQAVEATEQGTIEYIAGRKKRLAELNTQFGLEVNDTNVNASIDCADSAIDILIWERKEVIKGLLAAQNKLLRETAATEEAAASGEVPRTPSVSAAPSPAEIIESLTLNLNLYNAQLGFPRNDKRTNEACLKEFSRPTNIRDELIDIHLECRAKALERLADAEAQLRAQDSQATKQPKPPQPAVNTSFEALAARVDQEKFDPFTLSLEEVEILEKGYHDLTRQLSISNEEFQLMDGKYKRFQALGIVCRYSKDSKAAVLHALDAQIEYARNQETAINRQFLSGTKVKWERSLIRFQNIINEYEAVKTKFLGLTSQDMTV